MSQIFKDKIPDTIIFDFIEKYGEIYTKKGAFRRKRQLLRQVSYRQETYRAVIHYYLTSTVA